MPHLRCATDRSIFPRCRVSDWMSSLLCFGSEPASNSRGFPARRNEFPVLDRREYVDTAVEKLRKLSSGPARLLKFLRISLYFPCRTGICSERRVPPRLPPPPLSLRTQRLFQYIQVQTEKFTRFRGVLGVGVV
jgi:hypothetical protein